MILDCKIFNAVDLPIPFVPTRPKTSPGRGIGRLKFAHRGFKKSNLPMEFERVGRITVNGLRFQVGRQVDNLNGLEGTLLHTDTATNAKRFVNCRNFIGAGNLIPVY